MGFGRIGRNVFRQLAGDRQISVGAIVDIADREGLAYLLKYDSIYGPLPEPVALDGEALVVDGRRIPLIRARVPGEVDWAAFGVDVVVQATGKYRTAEWRARHLRAGATKAVGKVLPELLGKLDGMAMRVPVPDGSLVELVVELRETVDVEAVNGVVRRAANGPMRTVLQFSEEPLVSSDIIGNAHSSIFDAEATRVLGGRLVKVVAWYDNEWGYSSRVVDLIERFGSIPVTI